MQPGRQHTAADLTVVIIHVVFLLDRGSLFQYLFEEFGYDTNESNVRFVNAASPDTLVDDAGHLLTVLTTREIGMCHRTIVLDGVSPSVDWVNSVRRHMLWKHVMKGTITLAPNIVIPIIIDGKRVKETQSLSRRIVSLFSPISGVSVQVSFSSKIGAENSQTLALADTGEYIAYPDSENEHTCCNASCTYDKLWHTRNRKNMHARHSMILRVRSALESASALDSRISRNIGTTTESDRITSRSISLAIKDSCQCYIARNAV